MDILYPNCAGIDVHKQFLTVCRLHVDSQGHSHKETRTFGTMTSDLRALAAWLAEVGCTHVVMESTGVYWLPIYHVLEADFQVWVVNAQHIKRVPGRKTDVMDAEWLAQLLQRGLVNPSFVPPREQRALRDLVRYRQSLVEEQTRVSNRIEKVLEDANIKLAAVVTRLQGVSARAILHALLEGTGTPEQLADLAKGALRRKRDDLARALDGALQAQHTFLLTRLLAHLDFVDEELAAVEAEITAVVAALPAYQEAVERLDTIPGVNVQMATLIVAEIGVDMSRFPTDKQLTAWAGLAPGNNETGGKQRPARTRQGNKHLKRALVQAAQAAARTKDSYLRALYYRLKARRGPGRAAIAVARTILQIVYHMLRRGTTYQELGGDYFDRLNRDRTAKRLLHRLEHLGYDVQGLQFKEPKPAMAA